MKKLTIIEEKGFVSFSFLFCEDFLKITSQSPGTLIRKVLQSGASFHSSSSLLLTVTVGFILEQTLSTPESAAGCNRYVLVQSSGSPSVCFLQD